MVTFVVRNSHARSENMSLTTRKSFMLCFDSNEEPELFPDFVIYVVFTGVNTD